MYLKKVIRLRRTLAFRLTLWYAAIFTISSFGAFLVFYHLAASVIHKLTDQQLYSEISEYSSLLSLKGIDTLKTALVLEAETEGVDKIFFRIAAPDGREIAASNMLSWGNVGIGRMALKRLKKSNYVFETMTIPEHPYKVRILYGMIAPDTILQIGLSQEDNERLLMIFQKIFSATMAVLIVLGALIGWFMSKRALSGVEEVTRTAIEISKGAFDQRVYVKNKGDEIEKLANTFNEMLERIEGLIKAMREITDNIAHDMRSPITRIRGITEIALSTSNSMDEYKAMAANTIEECDRLLEMVNTMLDISEIEAGASRLEMEKTDMARLVRDVCELFQPTAEEKGIHIISEISEGSFAYGDIQKIRRMVVNLLDNAIKYISSEGTVTVSVNVDAGKVVISVNDTGIGMSREDLPHIFKRFYRCDQSRSQAGIGLGLSLSMAIARAHDGNITATSSPGKGSKFTITLPRHSNSR